MTELGQLVADLDAALDGEPRGLDFSRVAQERQLQRLAIQLWRETQMRASVSRQKFEEMLLREDLSPADLWGPGITESLSVASTPDEIEKYKKKLRIRADILTVLLDETIADLEKADRWEAAEGPPESSPNHDGMS